MAHIFLLETETSSPLESFLRELRHEVSRFVHLPSDLDLIIRDEDYDLDSDPVVSGYLASPQLLPIPKILIVREYKPWILQGRSGFGYSGFLLRPLNRDSVFTVVENALGTGGIGMNTIINSFNMPFYVLDVHSYKVVLANRAAVELSIGQQNDSSHRNDAGIKADGMGTTCFQLSHHNTRPCGGSAHVCPLEVVKETGRLISTEHIHYTAEGEERYVEVWGYPIVNRDNEVTHMIEYSIDISEKKREEREIKKLKTAIDRSDNIMLIADNAGVVEFVNRSFETKLGSPREDLLGKSIHDFKKDGSGTAELCAILSEAVKTQENLTRLFSYSDKEGSTSWETVSVTPVQSDKGDIINYIAVAEDISAQVEQRRELQQAKEEALRGNRMKSQFLANISHEIRTPLNIVLGFTDLLINEETEENKRQKLANIRHAGANLLDIINDVLDFSQLESSRLTLDENAFSLQKLLSHVHEMFKRTAEDKGLSFRIHCEGEVPSLVKGDEKRIVQVFSNLISNAIKFTTEGEVELLCVYRDEEIQAQVKDTGIGLDDSQCEEIFTPFEQIDGSTSRKYGGTGLGLAITKNLVEKMGGELFVKSSKGVGTCFTVSLPLPSLHREKKGDMGSGKVRESEGEPRNTSEPSPSPKKQRVLIAEDNTVNQKLMKLMVEKLGYPCDIASDGVETLEKLNSDTFDILLLDMHMPVKDGMEVIKEIRSNESLSQIYVIALTASAMEGDEKMFIGAGCDDYLSKPVNKMDLEAKLEGFEAT